MHGGQWFAVLRGAILVTVGCARPAVTPPLPGPADKLPDTVIRDAERRIRDALGRSDTTALAAMLDEAVTFVDRRGVVRGRDSVAVAVVGGRFGRGAYGTLVTFNEPERCDRGATLSGAYAVGRRQAGGEVGVDNGGFAIRLVWADTTARAVEIVFDWSANAARQKLRSGCREIRAVRLETSRVRVAILLLAAATWTANGALESSLREHGWTRRDAEGPTMDQNGLPHTRSDGKAPITSMVSVSLIRSLSLDLTTELQPRTGTLTTYNPAQSSLLTQRYRARSMTLTVNGQWRFFRLGTGPALVSSRWTERYEHLLLDSTTDPPSYRNDFPSAVESKWTRRSLGAALQMAGALPISPHLFATTTAAVRVGARAELPGVTTHEHWSASLDGSYLAMGLGYAW